MPTSLTNYPEAPFGIKLLGSTHLTELAVENQQIMRNDPLQDFFPQRTIQARTIKVEWLQGEARLIGVVRPGMNNSLNTFPKGREMNYTAAIFRRGSVIDQETLNYLRSPGKEDQTMGKELVLDQMNSLIEQGNLMMAFLRAQALSGGIDYTDPETGAQVYAEDGVPARNKYNVGAGVLTGSQPWNNIAAATPVADVQKVKFLAKQEGRNAPTHIVMAANLQWLLQFNPEIQAYMPNNTDNTKRIAPGLVTFNEEGLPATICGLKIISHEMIYDDYEGGNVENALVRRYFWPQHMVTFISKNNPALPSSEILGRTILTRGENPNGHEGKTGPWVATYNDKDHGSATSAPGVGMKYGMSGLPVLLKPKWVHHLLVAANEAAIEAKTNDLFISRDNLGPDTL